MRLPKKSGTLLTIIENNMQTKQQLDARAKTHDRHGKPDCEFCENGSLVKDRIKKGESGWVQCSNCHRGVYISDTVPENPYYVPPSKELVGGYKPQHNDLNEL
jgi:hypothetical protein